MSISRKDFFKTACLTGACLCGFGSLAMSAPNTADNVSADSEAEKRTKLVQEYLGALLLNMQENLDEAEKRKLLKNLAIVHYKQLNMDEFLKPYENNIEAFIGLLEKEWNWKVSYNKADRTIIADENKDHCVCPMINLKTGIKPAAICYCSEGFAELMFSKAVGAPVAAKVVSSIHRGDERCVYEITIS